MNLEYSEKSIKDLKSFSLPDRTLVVKKLHYLSENFEVLKVGKKVRELKGSEYGLVYRFIVARKIRVLFKIENNTLILLVLRVGFRKNIY